MSNQKRSHVRFTTQVGTFKYPKLNTPDTKFNASGEYGVKLILSEEDAAPIIAKMEEVAAQAFEEAKAQLEESVATEKGEKKAKAMAALKKLAPAPLPVKDVVDDDGEPTGAKEINVKMKATRVDAKTGKTIVQKPAIFDAKGKPISNPPSIWGGTEGAVSGSMIPYYTAQVGAGVSLRLAAVQIVKLVNGAGGSADQFGFGAKEGFEAGGDDSFESAAPAEAGAEDEF